MGQDRLDFETRAVHAGVPGDPVDYRPTTPAIHPATTFTGETVQDTHAALDARSSGFVYSRNANPTVRALETAVADLEGAAEGVAFSSGMAAFHASVLAATADGEPTVLAARDLYGSSRGLLTGLLRSLGLSTHLVDATDPGAVDRAFRETGASLICFEPISNPLLRVAPVQRLVEISHSHGARALVDNTFATPYLLRPLALGADLVTHSATKYLGGHGDVIAGVVICDEELAVKVREIRTTTGAVLGPFEAWLVLRGIRTLPLRMRKHCENAFALARWMAEQTAVRHVHYPTLEGRETGQFRDGLGGGMVAVETNLNRAQVEEFLNRLQVAVPATSLGDVETLVLYPPLASHRSLTEEERLDAGIGEGLIRISVGLEAIEDLFSDFAGAFGSVYTPSASR